MKNSESTGLAQSQGLTRIFYGMGGVTAGDGLGRPRYVCSGLL